MAWITCREPLQSSILGHLRNYFTGFLQNASLNPELPKIIDIAAEKTMEANIELATNFIVKTACEMSMREVDRLLTKEFAARQNARASLSPNSPSIVNQSHLPEPIRIEPGPISAGLMKIYDDYAANICGFSPVSANEGAQSMVSPGGNLPQFSSQANANRLTPLAMPNPMQLNGQSDEGLFRVPSTQFMNSTEASRHQFSQMPNFNPMDVNRHFGPNFMQTFNPTRTALDDNLAKPPVFPFGLAQPQLANQLNAGRPMNVNLAAPRFIPGQMLNQQSNTVRPPLFYPPASMPNLNMVFSPNMTAQSGVLPEQFDLRLHMQRLPNATPTLPEVNQALIEHMRRNYANNVAESMPPPLELGPAVETLKGRVEHIVREWMAICWSSLPQQDPKKALSHIIQMVGFDLRMITAFLAKQSRDLVVG